MKISRNWLQAYFEQPLPEAKTLADALTFHAFEIESVEGDILDVKVTPNRGHDCLSHRGIAKELSAILDVPMKNDPLRAPIQLKPQCSDISLHIEDDKMCHRYIAGHIRGVNVGSSPAWLKDALEAIGQKSINNVVDATNYVMFDLGQPLHAFDAGKISGTITIRHFEKGETLDLLRTTQEIKGGITAEWARKLVQVEEQGALVIADDSGPIALAGVKGGQDTAVDKDTTSIILEAANFDGVAVRRAAKVFALRTDASSRFEQVISPELAAFGMRAAAELIARIAGGEVAGFVDEYAQKPEQRSVSVSTEKINRVLGTKLAESDVASVFGRLGFSFTKDKAVFTVVPPFERVDIAIAEDLIEEVGRVIGYDKIPSVELPAFSKVPEINMNFRAAERAREELIAKGYSEVYTSVFADRGEREVLNKIGGERPFLRATLVPGLTEALEKNRRNKDLLGLSEVRIFEVGTVWSRGKERAMLATASEKEGVSEKPLERGEEEASEYEDLPLSPATRYAPFSRYPAIVRDIALWVPKGTEPASIEAIIRENTGELLVRMELFDRFEKGERLSLAFRLVFQSFNRTLTDEEANACMKSVYSAVKNKGWEVR